MVDPPRHHEGFEVTEGVDGERMWVTVPWHDESNRLLALDEAAWHSGNRYERAAECWMVDHACPDDCERCERDYGEVCSEAEERGEEPPDELDCWCHEFDGGGLEAVKEPRPGATPAYHIEDAEGHAPPARLLAIVEGVLYGHLNPQTDSEQARLDAMIESMARALLAEGEVECVRGTDYERLVIELGERR